MVFTQETRVRVPHEEFQSYSVVVSTLDFESSNQGSNPCRTFFFLINTTATATATAPRSDGQFFQLWFVQNLDLQTNGLHLNQTVGEFSGGQDIGWFIDQIAGHVDTFGHGLHRRKFRSNVFMRLVRNDHLSTDPVITKF